MNIGVKYCGGCNPKYDRSKFLYTLKKFFNYEFEIAKINKVHDVIIVLCGCTSCCADHRQFKFKYEKVLVRSEEDFCKAAEILKKYSNV
ncbi:MAG: hypothetical protein F8N39_20025 [Clostridiaceae bacterium]|nr:hypothetical protein [Clostridiaceae bacterium]